MRAVYPHTEGLADSGGVKIAFEVYGSGPRTLFFTAPYPIVHSRAWKAQVGYLSRHARVILADPRGNGGSDRPQGAEAYSDLAYVDDMLAVMDAVGVDRALLVALCSSSWPSLVCAARHPDRVAGVVCVATRVPYLTPAHPGRLDYPFDQPLDTDEGWAKDNKFYWQRDFAGFVDFFFDQLLPEPHSSKPFEDCVGWALETTPEILIDAQEAPESVHSRAEAVEVLGQLTCPVLAIHGDQDECQPMERSVALTELTGGHLVILEGAGHLPQARHPVVVNHLIREFLDQIWPDSPVATPVQRWRTSATRPKRALFLSSPIGLGHAYRDLAIARELRALQPDLEIDWLTQDPVTELLDRAGERVHPAARHLANESAHIQSECSEHDLHVFQALRRMDEILVNNFMVFDEVAREERYDLVIGDEAWDVDHFWHENPELKNAGFAWLTDFVGFLPFPDGGPNEAELTRDYNAEMVDHVARAPRIRDRSIFVGELDDIVPDGLGYGLPSVRDWTRAHYEFSGYITGFDPVPEQDLAGLRDQLGYESGEQVCVVTVGGSGVGRDLLNRAIAAFPLARKRIPGLRMVVVTGPRIHPKSLSDGDALEGLELRAYVPDLWQHLAVCDLAVVQGGLATTMELVAGRRPFVYVPLRHHFEQQFHVTHRLRRHKAGRRLDYEDTGPDQLAQVIEEEIGRVVDYVPIDAGGAARAAHSLASML